MGAIGLIREDLSLPTTFYTRTQQARSLMHNTIAYPYLVWQITQSYILTTVVTL